MEPGPSPGPGWTLGDDGHWKPPPFEVGGPAPTHPPVGAPPGVPRSPDAPPWPPVGGAPPPPWPPPSNPSASRSAATVGAIFGGFVLLAVICIAAVTLLGSSTPESERAIPLPTTTEPAEPSTDGPTEPEREPTTDPEITDSMLASHRVSEWVGDDEWRLEGGQELPSVSTDFCPPGWNTGADSRYQTVYDHLTGGRSDGEVTINVTVYETPEDAAADKERAGSPEWYDCRRQRIADISGDTNPTIQAQPDDPFAPGETYVESYRKDGQPVLETVHYVFVGQIRATITYCGCTEVGLEGRQAVTRDVAAALAEVQGLPVLTPG